MKSPTWWLQMLKQAGAKFRQMSFGQMSWMTSGCWEHDAVSFLDVTRWVAGEAAGSSGLDSKPGTVGSEC